MLMLFKGSRSTVIPNRYAEKFAKPVHTPALASLLYSKFLSARLLGGLLHLGTVPQRLISEDVVTQIGKNRIRWSIFANRQPPQ